MSETGEAQSRCSTASTAQRRTKANGPALRHHQLECSAVCFQLHSAANQTTLTREREPEGLNQQRQQQNGDEQETRGEKGGGGRRGGSGLRCEAHARLRLRLLRRCCRLLARPRSTSSSSATLAPSSPSPSSFHCTASSPLCEGVIVRPKRAQCLAQGGGEACAVQCRSVLASAQRPLIHLPQPSAIRPPLIPLSACRHHYATTRSSSPLLSRLLFACRPLAVPARLCATLLFPASARAPPCAAPPLQRMPLVAER